MKLYDISQEVFSSAVYPGDPVPTYTALCRTAKGDLYNLSSLSMCVHNGTHIDAPFHFLDGGKTVEKIDLDRFIGEAAVVSAEGFLGRDEAERILGQALQLPLEGKSVKRLLLKGNPTVGSEAARAFRDAGLCLIGVESQSVGEINSPMEVHRILLSAEVVLLEGLRLSAVPPGVYFLFAAPLALRGLDGSPVRAVLAEREGLI